MSDYRGILQALMNAPPKQRPSGGILGAMISALSGPSWAQRMGDQTKADAAAYQQGGIPALMANTSNTVDLFGGFAGATGPGKMQLPRLQSAPIVRINGENFLGYTHEAALERAAKSRGMNESVNDLVDGLGGWNKVRDNHFGYLNAADEFIPIRDAMDPTKYR